MNNTEPMVRKKRKLPSWFKAVFIKFWFAGAVFFFVGWGLFISTADQLDLTLALGLALGTVTDLMVNRIFFSMERGKGEYQPFIMFPQKKYWGFLLNNSYGIVLCVFVVYTYHIINVVAINVWHLPETSVVLGAEPILFGVFCLVYDMLFLQIKKLLVKRKAIISDENKSYL